MHVYVYIYMYALAHIYIYIYVSAYIYIHIHAYIYAYLCMGSVIARTLFSINLCISVKIYFNLYSFPLS